MVINLIGNLYHEIRHAILHGGDSLYATKVNSLKCILIFDYLLERLNNRNSMAN